MQICHKEKSKKLYLQIKTKKNDKIVFIFVLISDFF